MINLSTFFSGLGITGGNTKATNFYEFWKGIVMNGDTEINNITEFMSYLRTNRYEFFKSLNSDYPEVIDETSFYSNIDDVRIYDFKTFYTYAGEYFGGTPVTPTPTPTNTPTPTPTNTPTPSPSPAVGDYLLAENGDRLLTENDDTIEYDPIPSPTPTPTNTPTPTPTYTPYLSYFPPYTNQTEFILAATGATIPASGEIVFNNANACYDPKTTVMRISYTDRLGNDVETKVKSYTGATGTKELLTWQFSDMGSLNGPSFLYQTTSFTDYGTYLQLVHTEGNGTCASGLWDIGEIIQLAIYQQP